MAAELWNKVNVPFPGAISVVRIPYNETIESLLAGQLKHCGRVLALLQSSAFLNEIKVLYSILYVTNNSMRQHKHFRAIKQVERCINRLKEMKFINALKDLIALRPKDVQRLTGNQEDHIEVPSQPMLEWFCLKVLGASKLLETLLKYCSTAFSLTGQYLYWKEFILLNLVMTSMLSRLWVFFRGMLRGLIPLYHSSISMLHEVASVQPMPFLTGSALPADLQMFLGPSCWALLDMNQPGEQKSKMRVKGIRVNGVIGRGPREDLGSKVVERNTVTMGDISGFDMKDLLKQTLRYEGKVLSSQTPGKFEALMSEKRSLMEQMKMASSFKDLQEQLTAAVGWCKSHNQPDERRCLLFYILKCQRLKQLEAEGFRVEMKLKPIRKMICKTLLSHKASAGRCSAMLSFRKQLLLKRRRLCRRTTQRRARRANTRGSAEKLKGQSKSSGTRESRPDNADIDDIFASIGF